MRLGRFGAWAGCAAGPVAAGGGARKSCLPPEGEQIGDTNSVQRGNGNQGTMWWRRKQQLAGFRNCVFKII